MALRPKSTSRTRRAVRRNVATSDRHLRVGPSFTSAKFTPRHVLILLESL